MNGIVLNNEFNITDNNGNIIGKVIVQLDLNKIIKSTTKLDQEEVDLLTYLYKNLPEDIKKSIENVTINQSDDNTFLTEEEIESILEGTNFKGIKEEILHHPSDLPRYRYRD